MLTKLFYLFDWTGATCWLMVNSKVGLAFPAQDLLVGCLIAIAPGHVVAAPRTYFQLALFAFGIESSHAHGKFMHPPIVFLVFAEGKPKTVTRGEIADDLRETCPIVAGAINAHGLAAALLSEMPGAAIKTDAHPAGQRLPNRHQELEQRAQVNGERIKNCVRAN